MVFYGKINIRKLYPLIIFFKKIMYIREISRCKKKLIGIYSVKVLIPNMAGKFCPVMKVLYTFYKLKSGKWKKKCLYCTNMLP